MRSSAIHGPALSDPVQTYVGINNELINSSSVLLSGTPLVALLVTQRPLKIEPSVVPNGSIMPRTDMWPLSLRMGASPFCWGSSMVNLKDLGFGMRRPESLSCLLLQQPCDSGKCLGLSGNFSPHLYKDVSAGTTSEISLESGGWFPPPSGIQRQPCPMALQGGVRCIKRRVQSHEAAGWA